jgi:hypothetical protein
MNETVVISAQPDEPGGPAGPAPPVPPDLAEHPR